MRKLTRYGCVLTVATAAAASFAVWAGPQQSAFLPQPHSKVPATAAVKANPQTQGNSTSAVTATAGRPGATGATGEDNLPVRRVILYKSGVGYFEHQGRVNGNQAVHVDFTSGQLNDVLQSLTILDLSGGRIAGVDYNSEAPLSERLGSLRLPLEGDTDLSKFFGALRGARVEVQSGATSVTGRLLSVERKTRVSGGTTLEVDLATIVSDSGEVRSVELTPTVNVHLLDRDVNGEVSRYLGMLASVRQQDLRRMTIATAGTGDRQLYVSYISEMPVWKTTYRIVLPSRATEEPLLQGWAIVDNTVGEDWENVQLSLVAGAPQSFIQPLSQPLYTRRPVVPLAEMAQLTPQTHEGALLGGIAGLSGVITDASGLAVPNAAVRIYTSIGSLATQTQTDGQGHYQIPDLPAGVYRAEIAKEGFNTSSITGLSLGGGRVQTMNSNLQVGSVTQTVMVQANAQTVETETSESMAGVAGGGTLGSGAALGQTMGVPLNGRNIAAGSGFNAGSGVASVAGEAALNDARKAMEAVAQGADLGDLFEYKLKDPVTIRKNESALVPIVQIHVGAEKVSLWNMAMNSPRPLRALWLNNSSTLTLDGGSFSVLENEAFAGEGLLNSIQPGEKRLLSYAADLGVRVDAKELNQPQRVTRVRVAHGSMIQMSEMKDETTYTIRNDDTAPRTLLIEHPLRAGWLLSPRAPQPEETTSGVYRFRVHVDPKSTLTLVVPESHPLVYTFTLANVTDDQVKAWVRDESINPAVEAELRKILEQKDRVAALEDEVTSRDDEIKSIYNDQQRLRENLKALKGSPEERALTQRYTKQLDDQETRLQQLQAESKDLQAKQDQAQQELDKMIEALSMDTDI